MSRSLFWVHKSAFTEADTGLGFSVFSGPHLLWLAGMVLLIVVCAVGYRRCRGVGRANIRKSLALFLILFEIFKQCVTALTGAPVYLYLPLEICSFAEYVILIDAFWPKNWLFKQMLAFAFLPAAVMALLLPTVTVYPPVSFYAIHQFVMHACIVAYVIARYAAGEIRPRYAGLWASVAVIGALTVPVYFINRAFETDFMFLMSHEENPLLKLLWNLSGGHGGLPYVLALVGLSALVFHIMFGIFSLLGLFSKKRR